MLQVALAVVALANPMNDSISSQRLRATVEKLASFQSRNTLSPTLTDAANWLADEYRKIPGLQVEVMKYIAPKGNRVPADKEVVEVVATLPGEDSRVVLVGGHMDSLNLAADAATGRAPGANDDGSGTALALEVARQMAGKKWKHTLKFVAFSGEEQGLLGSHALALRAKQENWQLDAVLSNDMVGNSGNKNGQKNTKQVRVFSEEKDTHNSRELARFIEWITRPNKSFGVKLVFRKDRFGRGGDHSPFNDEGYTAVRFVEVHEEYTRQHTAEDLPEYMDWDYLANVTRMNHIVMQSLANAGSPPTDVRITRDQSHDTTLTWKGTPGEKYTVYWRETTSPVWEKAVEVGAVQKHVLKKVNKDDHLFAVGAVGGIPLVAR